MRDEIDPSESEYYQSILWIADERPRHFEQWQRQPWIGTRWQHATQEQLPGTYGCTTTLVMVQDLHESNVKKIVCSLMKLETQGNMLCAIVVRNPYNAWLISAAWRHHATPPAESMPLVIAVDTCADGYTCLRLLNQFTYAGMLICADWFDVRVSSAAWSCPHNYRHVGAENKEQALTQFSQTAAQERVSFALQLDPEVDLDSFSNFADTAESRACDQERLLLTSLFSTTGSWASEIHWLELFCENAKK